MRILIIFRISTSKQQKHIKKKFNKKKIKVFENTWPAAFPKRLPEPAAEASVTMEIRYIRQQK
jgi:hypothetical protein